MGKPRGNISAMVLVFQSRLTHSVWVDYYSQKRTQESLIRELRKYTKDGHCVAWRLIRHEYEEMGILTGPVQLKSEAV